MRGVHSIDEKIGQLFVVPARGDVIRHVRENHVGGVIWFESTTRATAEMNAELQLLAQTPLLISADLEAGMGMRFTDATWWPPAMAIAATGDPAFAEEMGRVTAIEALAIGVNHILAPVADVNVDPLNPVINTRSFGEDPREVARYVAAFVRGVQGEGALATAKHFPGHGDTHVDSHRALPLLDVSRERLERIELVPFRAAIEAGVASVMLGHLGVPALDDTPAPVRAEFENVYGTTRDEVTRGGVLPATVSPKIIRLLRDLGFDGLAITDSFDMGGLAAHFDPGEAAVRAIEAGEDQILFSADTDAAIAAVKRAVHTGRIAETRIDESVGRILRAKRGATGSQPVGQRAESPPVHMAASIAQRAITLVRDEHGHLPLRGDDFTAVVVSDLPEPNPIEIAVRELNASRVLAIDASSGDVEVDGAIVMLLALRPKSGAGRIAMPAAARRLAERHARDVIAVSFGSPYVLRDFRTAVCAYGIQPVMQRAAIRAIRGEAPMSGRLPVRGIVN
jgi:beta-N-acetylhexosaminidase